MSLLVRRLPAAGNHQTTSDMRIWVWMQRIGGLDASRVRKADNHWYAEVDPEVALDSADRPVVRPTG